MTTKEFYIAALQREARAFAAAARQHPGPSSPLIPTCPGWNLTDLLLHLGRTQRFVTARLRNRDNGPVPGPGETGFLSLEPQWLEWQQTGKAPGDIPVPPGLVNWFEEGAAGLAAALEEVDPAAPIWSFRGDSQIPAEFFQRQMSVEAALHRWDAQNALPGHTPDPVEPELAYAGLNLLFGFLPMRRKNFQGPPAAGETYHFHRTDGEGEWLLTFNGNELDIKPIHAKGDVAIRGTASDLLLFLWRRIPAERLEVFGKAELAGRYFELLPAI